MTARYTYEDRLRDHYQAYQLLKRNLRITFVKEIIKTISQNDLRNIYRLIHQKKPLSGQIPLVTAIPQSRESFLYLALFGSLYQCTSQVDPKSQIDVSALVFAWDLFCKTFPTHIREKRPYGKIRPANFNEAWVIAQGIRQGLVELQYCTSCRHNYVIIHRNRFRPVCQICELEKIKKNSKHSFLS
jgi:hypothetical protein